MAAMLLEGRPVQRALLVALRPKGGGRHPRAWGCEPRTRKQRGAGQRLPTGPKNCAPTRATPPEQKSDANELAHCAPSVPQLSEGHQLRDVHWGRTGGAPAAPRARPERRADRSDTRPVTGPSSSDRNGRAHASERTVGRAARLDERGHGNVADLRRILAGGRVLGGQLHTRESPRGSTGRDGNRRPRSEGCGLGGRSRARSTQDHKEQLRLIRTRRWLRLSLKCEPARPNPAGGTGGPSLRTSGLVSQHPMFDPR